MTPQRPPLPPGFLLAITAGVIGTALFALGTLTALELLELPVPLLEETGVQVALIAVGIVLMGYEVAAVFAFVRRPRDRDAD